MDPESAHLRLQIAEFLEDDDVQFVTLGKWPVTLPLETQIRVPCNVVSKGFVYRIGRNEDGAIIIKDRRPYVSTPSTRRVENIIKRATTSSPTDADNGNAGSEDIDENQSLDSSDTANSESDNTIADDDSESKSAKGSGWKEPSTLHKYFGQGPIANEDIEIKLEAEVQLSEGQRKLAHEIALHPEYKAAQLAKLCGRSETWVRNQLNPRGATTVARVISDLAAKLKESEPCFPNAASASPLPPQSPTPSGLLINVLDADMREIHAMTEVDLSTFAELKPYKPERSDEFACHKEELIKVAFSGGRIPDELSERLVIPHTLDPSIIVAFIRQQPQCLLVDVYKPLLLGLCDILETASYGTCLQRIPGLFKGLNRQAAMRNAREAVAKLMPDGTESAYKKNKDILFHIVHHYYQRLCVLRSIWVTLQGDSAARVDQLRQHTMDELKDYSKKEILGALTKTDPTTAAARLVDRTQEELKQSAARLAERSAQISFEAFPYEELPDNPNDIPLTSYLNFYPCPPEEYRKEAQQLYGQSIGREKQRHSDAAPKDNGENIHRPAAATIVNTLATLTPMKLVYEHPCLGGLAVIIDCATPNSGQGPLIRLDQLRVYYAYVESLGDDKNNPKYRYGSATVGAVDGKLVIGGSDHCVGQWSTDSLHLVTDDVIASKFHELTQSLLNAKQFSGMMVPSAVYVTTKSSERKPALIQDEVDRIRNSWFDGMRIFFNGLSPVRGIVESIKTNPTNGTLVITIGRNQIVFPAQFKPMVEVDAMVAIGDAIAEPQRPTKEEFGALPKKEQTALTELLIDGACIPLKPKTSRKGSVTVYDHTHVREKGVAFYPQGLIRDADVEYTYGYCDLPLGMAQVWDFGVIHTKKGKYVFNKESLIGDTELSGLHYDFYSPPRPKPVAK